MTNRVEPTVTVKVADDPDDDPILECAAAARSDFIVTNDDDLLRLKRYGGTQIVTVRNFLSRVRES